MRKVLVDVFGLRLLRGHVEGEVGELTAEAQGGRDYEFELIFQV